VDDLAGASLFLMNNYSSPEIVNVGTGREITIRDLALLIAKIVGFQGDIVQDRGKPDGAPRKLLDISRLRSLGWEPTISLAEGIRGTYEWYAAGSPAPSSPYAAVGQ
jgi:GDP-L-fucose synthase